MRRENDKHFFEMSNIWQKRRGTEKEKGGNFVETENLPGLQKKQRLERHR